MKDISLSRKSGDYAMYINAIPLFVLQIHTWRNIVRFVLNTSCQVIMLALLCAIPITVPKIIEYLLWPIFGGIITASHAKTLLTCTRLAQDILFLSLHQYLIIGRD